MSILVSLETAFPNSTPIATAIKAPAGPPEASMPNPIIDAPIIPVTALENITRGGAFSPHATAIPIAAPINCFACAPISTKKDETVLSPKIFAV